MLEAFRLPRGLRLALLWASMMFLYIYNDYIVMFTPGRIEMMGDGRMGPLGEATDLVLFGVAVLMAIPSLMVFLSAGAPAQMSKWLNVVFGAAYSFVNLATFFGSPPFYQFMVALELVLSVSITASALTWPKAPQQTRDGDSR
jgi:hypothetical protein